MASQPDVLQICLHEAATAAKPALERCIVEAVAALHQTETQNETSTSGAAPSIAWQELLKNKTVWSQRYPVGLRAKFKDFVTAAEQVRQTPDAEVLPPTPLAPTSAMYAASKLADLTPDMFTLVDDAQVAHAIEMARLLQKVLPVVEDSLTELNTLISSVQGLPNVRPEFNPLRPDVFTQVLQDITSAAAMTPAVSALCMRHLAGPLAHELNTIYRHAVHQLERAGVQSANYRVLQTPDSGSPSDDNDAESATRQNSALSHYSDLSNDATREALFQDFLRQDNSRSSRGLAPAYYASVDKELADLQEHTDSTFAPLSSLLDMPASRYASLPAVDRPQRSVGERSALDGQVWGTYGRPRERALLRTQLKKDAKRVGQVLGLEVVRKLVNQVAQDPRLLAPVREAVIALEPSLLRLAMVDPRFFSAEDHAGRRLMERVAQRSFKFNDEFSPDFLAFFKPVTIAFNELNTQIIESVQPFEMSLATLEYDWNAQDQRDIASRAKVLEALSFAQERQTTADEIAFELSTRPDLENVPSTVLDFLFGPWALVLAHAKLLDNQKQIDPEGFAAVVSDLIWSTQRRVIAKQPAKLIEMLPSMLNKLHDGLRLLGQERRENEAFFEHLMNLHRPALKLRSVRPRQTGYETESMPLDSEIISTWPTQTLVQHQAKAAEHPWLRREELDQAGFEDTVPNMQEELMPPEDQHETPKTAPPAQQQASTSLTASLAATASSSDSDSEAEKVLLGLQVNHWVDIYSRHRWLRAQLVWASSNGMLFMFVSHGGQPHSMTKRSGERLIRKHLLRPIKSHGVVAQALDQVASATAPPRA
ncbi:hypothetical protein AwPolaro_01150 [Polaromonas sp.]|nr:hypothetical protein AwPolaro_01150 [Polaromonas sp.]